MFGGAEDERSSYYESQGSQKSLKINMNDKDLDYLESQNDDEISGLSAKVKILKNVRFDRLSISLWTELSIKDYRQDWR